MQHFKKIPNIDLHSLQSLMSALEPLDSQAVTRAVEELHSASAAAAFAL
jgi:hypothetical protein